MIQYLRMLVATVAGLLAVLVVSLLVSNYIHAETQGTVPLEKLAHRGTALERSVARSVADSLAAQPNLPPWMWYARRERSADGDTIRFRIYRAKDANVLGRMLRPQPVIAGGAVYVVSTRELHGPGIGVR